MSGSSAVAQATGEHRFLPVGADPGGRAVGHCACGWPLNPPESCATVPQWIDHASRQIHAARMAAGRAA